MANLARVRTVWSGSPVTGGGVSTIYVSEAKTGIVAAVAACFTSVRGLMPTGITLTTENTGDLIDVETGAITGTWTDGSTSLIATNGTGNYAAGVGARVRWQTNGVTNRRRVRGSTFLVPLTVAQYDTDGTIIPACITSMQSAFGSLMSALTPDLKIYTRPRNGAGGRSSNVVGLTVPDRVSWLRSRRT